MVLTIRLPENPVVATGRIETLRRKIGAVITFEGQRLPLASVHFLKRFAVFEFTVDSTWRQYYRARPALLG
jgi:hypothetical protein